MAETGIEKFALVKQDEDSALRRRTSCSLNFEGILMVLRLGVISKRTEERCTKKYIKPPNKSMKIVHALAEITI